MKCDGKQLLRANKNYIPFYSAGIAIPSVNRNIWIAQEGWIHLIFRHQILNIFNKKSDQWSIMKFTASTWIFPCFLTWCMRNLATWSRFIQTKLPNRNHSHPRNTLKIHIQTMYINEPKAIRTVKRCNKNWIDKSDVEIRHGGNTSDKITSASRTFECEIRPKPFTTALKWK